VKPKIENGQFASILQLIRTSSLSHKRRMTRLQSRDTLHRPKMRCGLQGMTPSVGRRMPPQRSKSFPKRQWTVIYVAFYFLVFGETLWHALTQRVAPPHMSKRRLSTSRNLREKYRHMETRLTLELAEEPLVFG
jgi:hypothetical protein